MCLFCRQSERIAFLEGQLKARENEVSALIELLKAEKVVVPVQPAPHSFIGNAPLYVDETEEDAKWQLDNGLIDHKMYEDILKEAGLHNTEIQFDAP